MTMKSWKISGIVLIIVILSGCLDSDVILASGTGSSFTANVSGETAISDSITFVEGANVTLTQDTNAKTITIASSGGGAVAETDPLAMANISSNFAAWSLDTYGSGSVNATTCTGSPAQYSRYNGTGFDCYNDNGGTDNQDLANVLSNGNTANMDIVMDGNSITGYGNTNFPNTSLINYLLIATYGTNFPNPNITAANISLWSNQSNATVDAQIAALQTNDTNDRAYFNSSVNVRTTAGGTYNVSSLADLNSMLINLSYAPSLLGNVILQYQNNITGNVTIPALIYNGFTLTLLGEMKTDITFNSDSSSAISSSVSPYYGTIVDNDGAMTIDDHLGKIAYPSDYGSNGRAYVIRNNTATTIRHAYSTAPTVGSTNVKSWKYKHNGIINFSKDSSTYIQNLEIENFPSQTEVITLYPSAAIYIYESKLNQTNPTITTYPIIYAIDKNYIEPRNSVFFTNSGYVIRGGNYYFNGFPNAIYPSGIFINNEQTTAQVSFDVSINSYAYFRCGFMVSLKGKTTGQIGLRSSLGTTISVVTSYIIEGFDTGFAFAGDGTLTGSAMKFVNNTVGYGVQGTSIPTSVKVGSSSGALFLNSTTGVNIQGFTVAGATCNYANGTIYSDPDGSCI